jgi:hypothetical protein
VAIDYAAGNALGDGTLTYTNTGQTLQWTPNGGAIGTAVDVSADGRYVIADSTGDEQIHVTVTAASLPGTDQSDSDITIVNIVNETFDDISKQEALAGDTEYRCIYLYNAHSTAPMLNATIWLNTDALGADSLTFSADLAGVGDGSTSGVADTVANEDTAPDPALTFTAPASLGTGIVLGTLAAGDAVAVWVKRVVPVATTVSTPIDTSKIGIAVYI